MDKTYQPSDIESSWYQHWETSGYFKPGKSGQPYCIMIPPPNVTGSLHMGHAFQDTIMDALIRYHRMLGRDTLWQVGTDHAGIATQMVVERQLLAHGTNRHELGREKFLEKIWDWKAESGNTITRQLRRLGASVDWSRERFTMDEGLSRAVREVFIRLYDEGLIYRGKRLVNWDPKLHTAISDLEVISEEEKSHMWHFRYPLADGSSHITVATTRPETMLGDTAVAVHPDDSRYKHLIGKHILLPLTDRQIPIIADDYVDPEFGTGCVKITPAHDFNDYEMGLRHQLPLINIFTPDAILNESCPDNYRGMDRFEARKQIVKDMEVLGLLEQIQDHTLKIPRGDRSGVVIEPYLTDQWYVAVEKLAQPAIDAVRQGDIEFVPRNWENTYFAWMENLEDWCISRQLWWGHRIPAWYDDEGNIYVAENESEAREKYQLAADLTLTQDDDVLDTWFSSALWTFSTLGWPDATPEMQTYHPTNVLVTGFDIIFFWVARMIMMTLKFTGEVPFHKVYVHGLIRDGEGQKMSKSKGNVLDPIDIIDGIELDALVEKRTGNMMQPHLARKIEKATRRQFADGIAAYGTDTLRLSFCALATGSRDINFGTDRLESSRNFCNKVWNAARYVLMNTEGKDCGQDNGPVTLGLAERWIISRLQQVEAQIHTAFETYRFDIVAQTLYEFVWNEYCDWYLELSKPVLQDETAPETALRGTRRTLVRVLETILRLAHPIMPFLTEEIWQRVAPLAGRSGPSIMLQPYPLPDKDRIDARAIADIDWLKQVIMGIRNIRGEMNIAPGKQIPVMLTNGNEDDYRRLKENQPFLMVLARLSTVKWLAPGETPPLSAVQVAGELEIHVPMRDLIDKTAELARLNKEIEKVKRDLQRMEAKLGNQNFVSKAPPAVVEKEQQRCEDARQVHQKLMDQRDRIEQI